MKREREQAGYGEDGDNDDLNLIAMNSESKKEQKLTSDDNYTPHVSAAKRIRLEQEAILRKAGGFTENATARKLLSDRNAINSHDSDSEDEEAQDVLENENQSISDDIENQEYAVKSLLEKATKINQNLTQEERKKIANQEEEARILKEASKVQTNALKAASELAHGVTYTKSLPTTWTVPRFILNQGEAEWNKIRSNWHIIVEGDDVPPPMKSFADMKLPLPILNLLQQRNIRRPTPIQMQGLPVALAGRDMVGIAFTGSGKTMTFSLPLVMAALEEEIRMPLVGGEGPVGIILAPSRELVRQTFELVEQLCDALSRHKLGNEFTYPRLRCQLVIGGENSKDQLQKFKDDGVHCVVASPGRLRDFLKKKSINLDICRYICLDEADRMLDLGFDEEVGEIMNHFKHQRQTLLFSATFPKKFQDFAKQTLVQPIVVCRACRSGKFGRDSRSRIRETGGKDCVFVGMFTENSTSCHYIL
jgi:ATP-dependent RNA helicase DDX41